MTSFVRIEEETQWRFQPIGVSIIDMSGAILFNIGIELIMGSFCRLDHFIPACLTFFLEPFLLDGLCLLALIRCTGIYALDIGLKIIIFECLTAKFASKRMYQLL